MVVFILNKEGKYIGMVIEGDLLWYMKNVEGKIIFENVLKFLFKDVFFCFDIKLVFIDVNMEDLINFVKVQNFVFVVDDMECFIGIVWCSQIIEYCEGIVFKEFMKVK